MRTDALSIGCFGLKQAIIVGGLLGMQSLLISLSHSPCPFFFAASDSDGHKEMLLKQLGHLASSCSSQLMQYSVPRFCLDLLSGPAQPAQQAVQPPCSDVQLQAAMCLLFLAGYGSRLTCER